MKRKAITLMLLFILLFPVTAWGGLSQTEISQLYVAIFNRASEGEGNHYWQTLELDMATTADVMLETDAAKNYFGANLDTNQAFIEHIYFNTLNKTFAQDPDGIAYWVGLLDGGSSRGSVVASLVSVIGDYAPDGPRYNPSDTAAIAAYNQFTNRKTVSDYMADTVEKNPADWEISTKFGSSGLNVTDSDSSVTMAKGIINRFPVDSTASDLCLDASTAQSNIGPSFGVILRSKNGEAVKYFEVLSRDACVYSADGIIIACYSDVVVSGGTLAGFTATIDGAVYVYPRDTCD
jgi:hypothetical protein